MRAVRAGGAVGWCTMVGGGNDEGWGGLVGRVREWEWERVGAAERGA